MKKRLIFLVCILFLFCNLGVQAQNTVDGGQANQSEVSLSKIEDLSQSLEALSETPRFRIEADWINQRSKEVNVKMTVQGDNVTGDAIIKLEYFNKHTSPQKYEVTLYAYNHFQQVYVSTVDYLSQIQFFKKLPVNQAALKEYEKTYIEISNQKVTKDLSQDMLQNLFLLIPNLEKLATLNEDQIYKAGSTYQIGLWRREIPEYIFSGQKTLDFNLRIEYDLEANQVDHRLQIASKTPGLSLTSQILFDQDLVEDLQEETNREAIYHQVPGIKGKLLLEKLVEVKLTYNKASQEYRLKLAGLTENFNLNIFKPQTANFNTYEFESNLMYRPETWTMPEIASLNRLSEQELNYLLGQWVYGPYVEEQKRE